MFTEQDEDFCESEIPEERPEAHHRSSRSSGQYVLVEQGRQSPTNLEPLPTEVENLNQPTSGQVLNKYLTTDPDKIVVCLGQLLWERLRDRRKDILQLGKKEAQAYQNIFKGYTSTIKPDYSWIIFPESRLWKNMQRGRGACILLMLWLVPYK